MRIRSDDLPEVRLVALGTNEGYGAALNAGIAEASGDWILLMNADAWPQPHAIESLAEFADREPRAGIVGPRLVNLDGTLQPSVRGFPTIWRLATEYLFPTVAGAVKPRAERLLRRRV